MSEQRPQTTWIVSHELPTSFGDNWSSAKVLAWTLLDVSDVRIEMAPDSRFSVEDQYSWWLAAIELLTFGKGWGDLAAELRRWRMNNYVANDPVLKFVKNTWGETLVALEWYLLLHPYVRERVFQTVMAARGIQVKGDALSLERDAGFVVELFNRIENLPEHHPSMPFVRALIGDTANERMIEHVIKKTDEFMLGSSDPAHLSSHFSQDGVEWSSRIEPTDSIALVANHAILTVEKYEGWYHKIHDLHRESTEPENGLTDKEITSITVFVKDLGCLGTFVFDEGMQCFIRSYNAEGNNDGNTQHTAILEMKSPRFGIFLPHDISVVLNSVLDKEVTFPNDPVEELRLYSLDSIQLCGWIEYGITVNDKAGKFEEEIWSRSEKQWLPGHHFEEERLRACLIKMAKMGTLDLGERPLDQIINDSDSYDVQPWAAPFVLELWDSMVEFPTVLAEIAASDADDYFTLSDLEVEHDDGLRKIIGDMYDSIVSSDELAAMGNLPALLRGESLSAYEILSNLVDYPY